MASGIERNPRTRAGNNFWLVDEGKNKEYVLRVRDIPDPFALLFRLIVSSMRSS